jgi:hypothetical protein
MIQKALRKRRMIMKQQILFIQGGGEGAYKVDQELVLFLGSALGGAYELRYPEMPRENDPDYRQWKARIRKELATLEDNAILIGHSLGGSFLLKYISEEKIGKTITGIFLIAAPYWGSDGWQYEGYKRLALPEDFAAKLPRGTPIFFYHGSDDEVVPFAHLALYAETLPQAVIRGLDGRGHQLNNDLAEVVADIRSLKIPGLDRGKK